MVTSRRPPALAVCLLFACSGPDAPDDAVCADYVRRVCMFPRCEVVDDVFTLGADCEGSLLASSGCDDPAFTFTTPTRERFLECRAPLLREGPGQDTHPRCEDVAESFARCPDVVQLFGGGTP